MQKSDTAQLLVRVQAYDGREVTELTVSAWHEVIGHLDFGEATAAVIEHYGSTRFRIMPADIVSIAREQSAIQLPNLTEERERAERDEWLRARGIEPSRFEAAQVSMSKAEFDAWMRPMVESKREMEAGR